MHRINLEDISKGYKTLIAVGVPRNDSAKTDLAVVGKPKDIAISLGYCMAENPHFARIVFEATKMYMITKDTWPEEKLKNKKT